MPKRAANWQTMISRFRFAGIGYSALAEAVCTLTLLAFWNIRFEHVSHAMHFGEPIEEAKQNRRRTSRVHHLVVIGVVADLCKLPLDLGKLWAIPGILLGERLDHANR